MTSEFRKISILLLLLFTTAGVSLHAQQKDFQSWYKAGIEKGLKSGISIYGDVGQRFRNNSLQYDRSLVTVGASYSPLDYLKTEGGIRFLMASDKEGVISPKYRIHADATGKYDLGEVDLSLRLRFQYGFEEFLYFTDVRDNVLVSRARLKAGYHVYGTKFNVFAYVEPWGLFNSLDGRFFKKMRYSAGATYSLSFQSELSLRYMIEDEFNQANPLQSHILYLGYSIKL